MHYQYIELLMKYYSPKNKEAELMCAGKNIHTSAIPAAY